MDEIIKEINEMIQQLEEEIEGVYKSTPTKYIREALENEPGFDLVKLLTLAYCEKRDRDEKTNS